MRSSLHTLPSRFVSEVALSSWVPLCRTSDLSENNVYNVKFLDKSVDVVNTSTSFESLGLVNHRGAKLSHGVVDAEQNCLSCPYHGMKFDLDAGACTGFLGDYPPEKVKAKLRKHDTKSFDTLVWGYLGHGQFPS